MECVFRHSVMTYTKYEGITHNYPAWFRDEIVDHTYVDEYGYSVYNLDTLVEDWDIFLRNSNGDVLRTNQESFDLFYRKVRPNRCAPYDAFLEYYIWDDSNMESPKWLIEAFSEGRIWKERGSYWVLDSIKGCAVRMDPIWVILRNDDGDIKYTSLETFTQQFTIVPKYI